MNDFEMESSWWSETNWKPPILETPRLKVRGLVDADVEAVFEYSSNPNMTPYTLWDTHISLNDSVSFIREYARSRYREKVPEPLALVLKDDPRDWVIGTVGCFWVSKPYGTMELGYAIGEKHWNKGYATEAARVMLAHAFTTYAIERVQARCVVENVSSARVMEKVGMKYEGTMRRSLFRRGRYWDLRYYSILRDELLIT